MHVSVLTYLFPYCLTQTDGRKEIRETNGKARVGMESVLSQYFVNFRYVSSTSISNPEASAKQIPNVSEDAPVRRSTRHVPTDFDAT